MSTLYGYCNALPALAGHVYWDGAAPGGLPLYGVIWASDGGVDTPFYRGHDALRVYPRVTVYAKPSTLQQAPAARAQLTEILRQLLDNVDEIDTDLDGVTEYLPGSVQRQNRPEPMADAQGGGYYATLMLSALIVK
ncbi:hypothetical protein [Deinococcus humi]|uniref:DUF3168 domain-containing protein n=1 Tax=Deinococcus humi TaxID=662880 RepID=A0A7W8NE16_9DEIO|nr:hypothetical protein [Deinococcus humi]MBB5361333.1 hypothetical protein [Deinococcus humi]GGO19518.1 hypothetical protein GCM10008949_03970 [Deinococcus humi]